MLANTAVGRKHDPMRRTAAGDDLLGLLQPGAGLFVEALALHADRRAEQCHETQPGNISFDPLDGGIYLENHAGCDTATVEKIESLVGDAFIFNVKTDQVAARIGELLDLRQDDAVGDHQVNMDLSLIHI